MRLMNTHTPFYLLVGPESVRRLCEPGDIADAFAIQFSTLFTREGYILAAYLGSRTQKFEHNYGSRIYNWKVERSNPYIDNED